MCAMTRNTDFSGKDIEEKISDLLIRVGERVRKLRNGQVLPRRLLSEKSGVSARYLAQLESGRGNISIGLLQRVAIALETPIEFLLSESDVESSSAIGVARLYRQADDTTREDVMRLLDPEHAPELRSNRICLVGLRGAGKSTLGARAAHHLDIPFVELNHEIERESGMPQEEVLELYGAEGYRKFEAAALDRVIETHSSAIIAAAGGIVADSDSFDRLLRYCHTIWVQASPTEHMARVRGQGDERPMAGNPSAMEQLRSLLTSREVHYSRASARLDTSGKSVQASLNELLALIQARGLLS